MAFLEIHKRCQDCEKTRELLREAMREVDSIRLDYQSLYEKVRVNLSKLKARSEAQEPCTENAESDLDKFRKMFLEKRLGRQG